MQIDIICFLKTLAEFDQAVDRIQKQEAIQKLKDSFDWHCLYHSTPTNCNVICENESILYPHEIETAIKLADIGYDILFVPKSLFKRGEKKYDILLLKKHIKLEVDLKAISSLNVDTIAKRIRSGCDQAPRIIVDIKSNIKPKDLIIALRSAAYKNSLMQGVFLFYKKKFFVFSKNSIMSKQIYGILK